ncbi:GspH/FimT family pseudopilin [Ramlibacter sp.]|uniref:GspH/FimT family pseudopilin n=1 Tax=Ramlibacter sp. TaxID=1917967 RepID=UPI003D1046AA
MNENECTRGAAQLLHFLQSGLTLVEMLVALAVLGGVLAIGGSALGEVIASVRLSAATDSVVANLNRARGEAVARNMRVVYCKSADGATCAVAGGWEQGGIVFQDANDNSRRDPDEPALSLQQPFATGTRIRGNGTVEDYVSFAPDGRSRHSGSGAFQAGTITVCHASAGRSEARQVVVNSGGRPRVQKAVLPACP